MAIVDDWRARTVIPGRYARVADIARDAADRGAMDLFSRLGNRWVFGQLSLDQFAELVVDDDR